MTGTPEPVPRRHLGVGLLGLAAATVPAAALLVHAGAGYAAAVGLGAVAALAAVPVLPGRAAERPRAPAAA